MLFNGTSDNCVRAAWNRAKSRGLATPDWLIPSELTLCQKPSNATELPKSNFRRVLVLVDDIALSYVSSAGENGECATLWFCGLNSFIFVRQSACQWFYHGHKKLAWNITNKKHRPYS